jgi:[ribosomal protein S5]-alanine N-acetyltransferase
MSTDMTAYSIRGKRVLLRKPIPRDLVDYVSYDCGSELMRMLGRDHRQPLMNTQEAAVTYFENIRSAEHKWCIEYEGRFIGKAGLRHQAADHRARYSISILDAGCWGKGIGTEVTNLILQYAFQKLKLHRVDLRVLEYNRRAIACYEKCGFVVEGVEREGAFIDGRYETDVIMSILDREYNTLNKLR